MSLPLPCALLPIDLQLAIDAPSWRPRNNPRIDGDVAALAWVEAEACHAP